MTIEELIQRLREPVRRDGDRAPVYDPVRLDAADTLEAALRVTAPFAQAAKLIDDDDDWIAPPSDADTLDDWETDLLVGHLRAIRHWRQTGKVRI